MKINIVKFKDGQYAVMRTIFGIRSYYSIYSDYWWRGEYHINRYCKTTKKDVEKLYNKLINKKIIDRGIIVK